MPRRLRLLLVAVPLVTAFAPAPKPRDDTLSLQGTWVVVRRENKGRVEEVRGDSTKVVIKGDRWEFRHDDSSLEAYKVALDPKKKPKEITLTHEPGPGRPAKKTLRGIYQLERDTVTVCYGYYTSDFPIKEFATRPDNGRGVFVLRCVKP
jgi:uncharacterized protein (TIGR03067 family)